MAVALMGATIFDGERLLGSHAVVIEDRKIQGIMPASSVNPDIERQDLAGGILAPGFVDVQVNGGGGIFVNAAPTAATLKDLAAAHRRFGTTGLLPTVITDAPEILAQAIAAVKQARLEGNVTILGIHVEGPFLDPKRKGAHDAKFIRVLTDDDIERLASAEAGLMMLTLAPNMVTQGQVRRLAEAGILVSLGHAEASAQEAANALHEGARAFTHLFNAMSQMNGREPGMVGAALADEESYVSLIADGHHVSDIAMRVALSAKERDRIMLITDAMPPAAGGPTEFAIQGRTVRLTNGRLELADGTLAGSNLTMDEALRHCVQRLDVPLADALRMASLNPAAFLRCDDRLGRIRPHYLANLVHLGNDLKVRRTWVEGASV